MVTSQIQPREVKDPNVLEAMQTVPQARIRPGRSAAVCLPG